MECVLFDETGKEIDWYDPVTPEDVVETDVQLIIVIGCGHTYYRREGMNRFALVVLTDTIKVREFEHAEDWVTARQTLATKEIKFISLKFHEGVGMWVMPEQVER